MPTFRTRVVEVKAYRGDNDLPNTTGKWPRWLQKRLESGRQAQMDAVPGKVYFNLTEGLVAYTMDSGRVSVTNDDFIVLDQNKQLSVRPAAEFLKEFELAA